VTGTLEEALDRVAACSLVAKHAPGSTCPECGFAPWPVQRTQAAAALAVPDARTALLDIMLDLSETYWCASWLVNLDKALAEVLARGVPGPFGLDDMDPDDFERLRSAYEKAGGWWQWDETEEVLPFPHGIPVRFVPDAKEGGLSDGRPFGRDGSHPLDETWPQPLHPKR
jgi:hypothetical protein